MSEQLISTIDGKSLYAKSAASAGQSVADGNGDNIADTYAKKTLVDQLGSALTGVQQTLYSQEGKWNSAASAVSANSGNWQDSYETVTANSADWGKNTEYTAGNGIEIDENNGINVKRALDLADSGADKAKLSVGAPAGPMGVYGTIIDGKGITAGMQAPAGIEAPRTVIGAADIVVNKYEGASPIPGLSNISVTGLAANKQDKTGMTAYTENSAFNSATAWLNSVIAGQVSNIYRTMNSMNSAMDTKKQDKSSMTAYQPVIEYGYDSDSKITAIDGTALAGGGGGDTSMCYPLTGGNLKGQLIASGAGSPSTAQTAPVYGKITATQRQNQAGLMTNGSVFAGDYKGTASQTIAVRRSAANSALAGCFQLYSDGAVSFQQISNDGTADSIVCQLQYGQTNTGFNWGTMASGSTVKHIAYTEDLTGQGKTYEGVAPIVVDNTANTISITGLDQFQKTADMTAYQTVEGMTGYQSAGEYVDNSAFTAATAGLNNGIAGLGNSLGQAIDNLGSAMESKKQDKSSMTAYQTVEDMTAYQSAGEYVVNSAFTAATAGLSNGIAGLGNSLGQAIDNLGSAMESKKQDKSSMTAYQTVIEYGYNDDNQITAIDGTALAGGGYTGDIYQTVAGNGISIVDDQSTMTTTISVTGLNQYQKTADMTAFQTTLQYGYDSDSKITAIDGTALAGGVAVEGPVTSGLITNAVSGTHFGYNACIFAGNMVVLSISFNPMANQTIGTTAMVKIGQLTDSRYYPAYTITSPYTTTDNNIYGTMQIGYDGAIYMRASNTSGAAGSRCALFVYQRKV